MVTLFVIIFLNSFQLSYYDNSSDIKEYNKKIEKVKWESLIFALCEVESESNPKAYNSASGALGILQQKKIYVDEVNRICKIRKLNKRFKYSDRIDTKKAREMFDIYQSHHNPLKNIDKAIKIHRGLNSPSYKKAIKQKMKNYEQKQFNTYRN